MWIRFETCYRHQATRWGTGVLHFVPELLEWRRLTAEEAVRVRALRDWFNRHLPVPPDARMIDPRAIFWFRGRADLAQPMRVSPWKRRPLTKLAARAPRVRVPSDRPVDASVAAEAMAKMREFVALAEEVGFEIRVVETQRPGYVIYEDAYQIAAIPFRDAVEAQQGGLED